MGGGGKSSSSSNTKIRYAKYVEEKHSTFLTNSEDFGVTARANNPYTDYVDIDFDDAFYGAGYSIASFPSLYDMFGKFMAGLDIEALFEQVLYDVQNTETIQNASNAHQELLNDDIEQSSLPRFKAGMRDINSVMSSSFIIGQSIIENARVKKVAEFDANLRYKLIPIAAEVFSRHLAWNQSVITAYQNVMKFAIVTKMDTDSTNYDFAVKGTLWPFTVLEQERANLGALQGAMSRSAGDVPTGQKLLGGIAGGAALGASTGFGVPGAVVGGLIGGIGSLI